MAYIIYAVIAIVVFLVMLNGFLRGAKKDQIDAVLGILLLVLIISAFVISGWKSAFLAIAIAVITAVISRPLAARSACKFFAASTGGESNYVGLPSSILQKISRKLADLSDPSSLMEGILHGGEKHLTVEKELIDYCMGLPGIELLLKEFKVSSHDLEEIYHRLLAAGAGQFANGHWVAASALAYPESLRYLLDRKEENIRETAFNLIMYFERGVGLKI